MKVSLNWIKDFVNIDASVSEISSRLTSTGLEIGGEETIESIKGGLKGFVVGHVEHIEKHPNADKLKLTKINIGSAEPLSIVCGAPNVALGQNVVVATIGTVIYAPNGESFTIKKSKLRGELSEGMLCSEVELNLGTDNSGIMVLKDDIIPGSPITDYYPIYSDTVLDVDLTPNRTDAMSQLGVAKDLCASYYDKGYKITTPDVSSLKIPEVKPKIEVVIEDEKACLRYTSVSIKNITVKDSPEWLKNRLLAIGIRSINNIVDVTNYVMHELGLPLHAFDSDRILGGKVIIKKATEGSEFVTLDGEKRKLSEHDLMINNASEPMCIAGVFGGLTSGVSTETKNIFLESACFDSTSIRKTAKRQQLNTDASYRYERGADISLTPLSLKRAAALIVELAGGEIDGGISDIYPSPKNKVEIEFNLNEYTRIIGEPIDVSVVVKILEKLEFEVVKTSSETLILKVPFSRVDVTRPIDVVEELVRIVGFDNIATTDNSNVYFAKKSLGDKKALVRKDVSNLLVGQGFQEVINNSLMSSSKAEKFGFEKNIGLKNALSNELDILRPDLIFNLLDTLSYNVNRKRESLSFFEFGKAYEIDAYSDNGFKEVEKLCLLSSLEKQKKWDSEYKSDFYVLKASLESILNKVGFSTSGLKVKEFSNDRISHGIQFLIKKQAIASIGLVSKNLLKAFDIDRDVYFADVHFNEILKSMPTGLQYKQIVKFPLVNRDLALLVEENISFNDLAKKAKECEQNLLKEVDVFDVYKGKNLPEGKKSYALRFTLSDVKETLTDKRIEASMKKIQDGLMKAFKAEIR